jgi:hypothetical protein
MVGGVFVIATMSCWGERFTKVGTGSGLLGIVPWCAMATCIAFWEAVAMTWHKLDWRFGWHPKSLKDVARRHLMPHNAHNGLVVWMRTPRCN